MAGHSRFKFPKMVLFAITILYVIVILATYALYYKDPLINCTKQLFIVQGVALILQVVLNYINYKSKEKIIILTTLFVSAMLIYGILSSFFNLELMCRYFGY